MRQKSTPLPLARRSNPLEASIVGKPQCTEVVNAQKRTLDNLTATTYLRALQPRAGVSYS